MPRRKRRPKSRWPRWLRRLARRANAQPRERRAQLRVVTFNAYSAGNKAIRDNLCDLIEDAGRPEVVALQEAWRLDGSVPGYRRVGDQGSSREVGSSIALVRLDVEVTRERVYRVGPGWSWQGNKRAPREFVDFTVAHDGMRWDFLATHRTPGGPYAGIKGNRASWAAEDRAIDAWFDRREDREDRPKACLADHNGRAGDLRARGIGDLARRVGAKAALRGIDGALVTDARARTRKMKGRYGSDAHHPVIVDLTAVRPANRKD